MISPPRFLPLLGCLFALSAFAHEAGVRSGAEALRNWRPGTTGEVAQANIAWSDRKGVPGVPSPLYCDGRLYTFKDGGLVFCRAADTGELLYDERLGTLGYYYSSPVAADHKIYIASAEGVVTVIDAGPKLNVLAQTSSTARSWPHPH